MRTLRDTACLLVALGSVALAAWQPVVSTEPVAGQTSGSMRPVGDRSPCLIDRAIFTAPLVKT